MPFGAYSTFSGYDLTDQVNFINFASYEAYGSRSYKIDYAGGEFAQMSSFGFNNQFGSQIDGNINGVNTQGQTSYAEAGYTTALVTTTYTASGSNGTTTEDTNSFSVSFLENQGFASTFYQTPTNYYFSDNTDESYAVLSNSHGQTTASVNLRQTSSTELTLFPPVGDSVTYSEATSYITNSARSFTDITSVSEYGYGIDGVAECNKVIGKGYVIFPVAGTNWTADGTGLMYRRLFTSTGTYGEYYTNIFKDNATLAITIPASESYLSPNGIAQGTQVVTLFSDEAGVITYDIVSQQSESFTLASSYYFAANRFVLDTNAPSATSWYSLYKVSSELSYTNQYGATIGAYGDSDNPWVIGGVISSTKLINVDTTINSFIYSFVNTKSTFVSYRALAKTISTLSYILYDYETDVWGSSSRFSTSEYATTIINTIFDDTEIIYQSGLTSELFSQTYISRLFEKNLYSLEYYSSINPTFFTQQSPNFNWVVADSANLSAATKYFNSLSPSSALTKLYFTTYKYHRYGIVNAPIFAVPIDFTEESDSSYTYQAVSIPPSFYFGSSPASATQTYSTLNGTTLTTSSFTIGYAGSGSFLKMKEFTLNDMSGGGDPSNYENIFHTIAVEQNSSGCASWSMDNYYYWIGTDNRVISGTASNPISIIGDYHPFTVIASEWGGAGLPYLAIDVTYQNSYSYN